MMLLEVVDVNNISPVETEISLSPTVTVSRAYCEFTPTPNKRAPLPPVCVLLSYPIIAPSISMPANNNGFNLSLSLFNSRVCRMICRSLIKLSTLLLYSFLITY